MTELRVVFLKDLRRLRWLLALWLGATVAQVVVQSVRADLELIGGAPQVVIDTVGTLLAFVVILMPVLLVSRLVHDEPLVNADAFWLTRPIRPTMLMVTKLAFGAVWLVVVPAVAEAIAVAWVTRDSATALGTIGPSVVLQALWVASLVAIATLTPSTMRFLMSLIGVVAGLILVLGVIVSLLATSFGFGPESIPDTMLQDRTGDILQSVLIVIVAAALIASQYRTRRLWRSISLGAVILVLGSAIVAVWPWRFAKPAEPDPGPWAHDTTRVAAALDPVVKPYVIDAAYDRPGRTTAGRKWIAAPIELTGIPRNYVVQMGVRARLAFADGALDGVQRVSLPVSRPGMRALHDYWAPIRAALEPSVPLRGRIDSAEQWPVVLAVSAEDLARRGTEPGRLTVEATALLSETRVSGSMPLAEGATAGSAPRFVIRRVFVRPDGCSVLIRRIGIAVDNVPFQRYQFVLRNAGRAQFALGDPVSLGARSMPLLQGWVVQGSSNGAFADMVFNYPSRGIPRSEGDETDIDADWLRGADVAVVETSYRGRVSRSLTVDGFVMKR